MKQRIIIFFLLALNCWICKADLPEIIAHRTGKNSFKENSAYSIRELANLGIKIVELDVQLSKDNIPILYHPRRIKINNNESPVSNFFFKDLKDYGISSLDEALKINPKITLIIDLKSDETKKLIDSTVEVVKKNNALNRVVFYSTIRSQNLYLLSEYPQVNTFEPRDLTRLRNITLIFNNECRYKSPYTWVGLELSRDIEVREDLTIGEGVSKLNARLWNQNVMKCTKYVLQSPKVVLFGVNNKRDYCDASKLEAYAVYTDEPIMLTKLKHDLEIGSSICN